MDLENKFGNFCKSSFVPEYLKAQFQLFSTETEGELVKVDPHPLRIGPTPVNIEGLPPGLEYFNGADRNSLNHRLVRLTIRRRNLKIPDLFAVWQGLVMPRSVLDLIQEFDGVSHFYSPAEIVNGNGEILKPDMVYVEPKTQIKLPKYNRNESHFFPLVCSTGAIDFCNALMIEPSYRDFLIHVGLWQGRYSRGSIFISGQLANILIEAGVTGLAPLEGKGKNHKVSEVYYV